MAPRSGQCVKRETNLVRIPGPSESDDLETPPFFWGSPQLSPITIDSIAYTTGLRIERPPMIHQPGSGRFPTGPYHPPPSAPPWLPKG